MVSGASAYREGEFLYQDYIYDDLGATNQVDPVFQNIDTMLAQSGDYSYPADPAYAKNAADIVEVRLKLTADATAFRITYNSMIDPSKVAITIGMGDSATLRPMPHGANAFNRAAIFATVHGSTGDIVEASTGALLASAPNVGVDLPRRQIEIRVPFTAFDPRGSSQVRISAAAGLWDTNNERYLIPQTVADAGRPGGAGTLTNPPAFFNIAFRYDEPAGGGYAGGSELGNAWREYDQAAALMSGDISKFGASVDFIKLAANINDDMLDEPGGIPQSGFINRIFVSRFENAQGRGDAVSLKKESCPENGCIPRYAGRLQPYSVYIPRAAAGTKFGLMLDLHAAGTTHNYAAGTLRQIQFSQLLKPTLVMSPLARGEAYWYYGQSLADVFEAWADLNRNYEIDSSSVSVTGISQGGYGAIKLAAMWPDLFAASGPMIPCPGAGTFYNNTSTPGGLDSFNYYVVAGLRHVPLMVWNGAADAVCNGPGPEGSEAVVAKLDELGFRYSEWSFAGMGHNIPADAAGYVGWFKQYPVVNSNPAHISYAMNTAMSDASIGIEANHVYWVSEIALRDGAGDDLGSIDVFSHGFGMPAPTAMATTTANAVYDCAGAPCVAVESPGLQKNYQVVKKEKKWDPLVLPVTKLNQLDIGVKNVGHLTIDTARAQVDCAVVLKVSSDGPVTVTLAGCPGRALETY